MISELASQEKVIGVKQSRKAIREGRAKRVYLACDADPAITEPVAASCAEAGIPVETDYTCLLYTSGVEGTHGQLGAGFADGLGGNDADRLARTHRLLGGQVHAVALGAHAAVGLAGQHLSLIHICTPFTSTRPWRTRSLTSRREYVPSPAMILSRRAFSMPASSLLTSASFYRFSSPGTNTADSLPTACSASSYHKSGKK